MTSGGAIREQGQQDESAPWLLRGDRDSGGESALGGRAEEAQSLVEGVVESDDGEGPSSPFAKATKVSPDVVSPGERRVLRKQLQSMQDRLALPR
jgi:hypothetical protein